MTAPPVKSAILLLTCLITYSTFSQNKLFVGTYTNTLTGITITINEDYTGNYNVFDQNYPVKATLVDSSQLSGIYPYNNQEGSFDIIFDGNTYSVKTESIRLRLIYQPKVQNQVLDVSASKQAIQESEQNEGSKLIISLNPSLRSFPIAGYQFKGPNGWEYQLLENYIHFFQSDDKISAIVILPHDYNDINQIKLLAQTEGIQEDNMLLMPSQQVENYGNNGLLGTFSGWIDGVSAKAAIISLFSPYGGGVTIMAYTQQNQFNSSYIAAAKKIANSVKFTKPVESESLKQWQKKLTNQKLVYYDTGDNSTQKMTYTLYSNGQFLFYNESSYSSSDYDSDFSYAGSKDDSGNWKIKEDHNGIFIDFNYLNGSSSRQYLKMKEGSYSQIFLNGSRYFITSIED